MRPTISSMVILVTTIKILDINVDSFVSCGTISLITTSENTNSSELYVSDPGYEASSLKGKICKIKSKEITSYFIARV